MDQVDCQLYYNLVPMEEIGQEYCVSNDFCPASEEYSNIIINGISFPGKSVINIDIPDYITWDYTGTDSSFDLFVGSGYDVDYINSIVDINSYRPTSEDFTDLFVGGLTLVFPYIVISLFIVFVWKLIKRIFKS